MKKKLIATLMACVMTIGMGVTAFATDTEQHALSFNKRYKIENENTVNPGETFQFNFSNGTLAMGEQGSVQVPTLPQVSAQFSEGTATKSGLTKPIILGLENVTWPSVGIYTYDIAEVKGTTAGVTYDSNVYKMDVLVEFVNGQRKPVQVSFYKAGCPDEKMSEFVNVYSAGCLAVSKEVTGNMGDKNKDFEVQVTFTAPKNKEVKSTITYIEDGQTKSITPSSWKDGSCTVMISLKNAETVTFKNIPYGVSYTVVEDDYTTSGYDRAKYTENNGTANDGKGTVCSASDCVKITNNKNIGISTGITSETIPFILILGAVAVGLILFLRKKFTFGGIR